MTEILLQTDTTKSVIRCGKGAFEKYAPALKDRQLFLVTDENVFALYENLIRKTFGNIPIKVLPAGEKNKTSKSLFAILRAMAEAEMKRTCTVIALGGGVIGDVAGLASALYMRGVHLVQIPTTLLAQVDSSVGGKTAVDFMGVKNLVGTFYQPEEVIADPLFLQTLPAREINCGLGEIIKHGALDRGIFEKLSSAEDIFDFEFLGAITADNIRFKADVVSKDEREKGLRKILNLGHTTGHAFELYYKRKSHGEFVLIGMFYEMYIAKKSGVDGGKYFEELERLIRRVVKNIPAYGDIEKAGYLAKLDKKNADEKITLIVPKSAGESAEIKLNFSTYVKYLAECRDNLKGAK